MAQLCHGLTNRQIAAALHISSGTVANYLAALFVGLNVNSREDLKLWWWLHHDAADAGIPVLVRHRAWCLCPHCELA